MASMITRRTALLGSLLAGPALLAAHGSVEAAPGADVGAKIAALEREHGCRFGVAVLDPRAGTLVGHRLDERFPLCSTFKVLAAALVLSRVDAGDEALERRVVFEAGDLVDYSPVTKTRVGGDGMTIAEICEAAITLSDNTAGNLLLDSFGGPVGLTAFVRARGDAITRLDRRETELNDVAPGDPRDTTTPAAMARHLADLVLGDALAPASRQQLSDWLHANKTGAKRLKAGLPEGWRIGDKTGTSDSGIANDVGVVTPPDGAPIVLSVYLAEATTPVEDQNAAIAKVARIVAKMV